MLALVAMAVCVVAACGIVTLADPLLEAWLGAYRVVAASAIVLLVFGVACGILTRMLVWFWPLVPGNHSMDDAIFVRWKLLIVLYHFGRSALLPFSAMPLRPAIAMLFGARVGRNVAYGGMAADLSLVTIGDDVVLGHNSVLTPHAIASGRIVLAPIIIGRGATIGVNAVVMAGVEVGENSVVTAGAVVPPATKIPSHQLWGGVPARRLKELSPDDFRA